MFAPASHGFALAPAPEPLDRRHRPRSDRPPFDEPPQLGGQLARRAEPVRPVLGEGLQDDRLQVARDVPVKLSRRRRRVVADPLDQTDLVGLLERRPQGQQLVQRRPQRIDIAAAIRRSPESLGRHVAERPDQLARLRAVGALLELRQAEVGDPDVAHRVQEQVRRLDVAMQHAATVGVLQGVGHLDADSRDLAEVPQLAQAAERRRSERRAAHDRRARAAPARGRPHGSPRRPEPPRHPRWIAAVVTSGSVAAAKRPVRGVHSASGGGRDGDDPIEAGETFGVRVVVAQATDVGQDTVQGLTLDELHGVVADPVMFAVVEDADDIRMVQPGRQAGLGVEPPQVFRVGPESRLHDLERHPVLERLVLGLVHHAHSPAADPAEDEVVTQPLGRRAPVRRIRSCPCVLTEGGVRLPVEAPSCSSSTSAGINSRIRPASSGWRAISSESAGRSPRRNRSRNDSTTGPRGSSSGGVVDPPVHDQASFRPSGKAERMSLSRPKARR